MWWLLAGYVCYQAGKSNPATVVVQPCCDKPTTVYVVATPAPKKKDGSIGAKK